MRTILTRRPAPESGTCRSDRIAAVTACGDPALTLWCATAVPAAIDRTDPVDPAQRLGCS